MKVATQLLMGLVCAASWGQAPDFTLKLDLLPNYTSSSGADNRVRWYDPLGRHSVVGFGLNLEPGYYLLVTQRLQRVKGDIDQELIDEAYLEDPGLWRIGRQYLPFGSRNLIHVAALGGRLDGAILDKKLPVSVAAFDNGRSKLRGVMARAGSGQYGVSLGLGQHFAADATSLGALRSPESATGPGRGYRVVFGLDGGRTIRGILYQAEYIGLRRSHSKLDSPEDISDLRATFSNLERNLKVTVGWARAWRTSMDVYRLESELKISKPVSFRTILRFERGVWKDLSVGLRVRL